MAGDGPEESSGFLHDMLFTIAYVVFTQSHVEVTDRLLMPLAIGSIVAGENHVKGMDADTTAVADSTAAEVSGGQSLNLLTGVVGTVIAVPCPDTLVMFMDAAAAVTMATAVWVSLLPTVVECKAAARAPSAVA